MTGQVLFIPHGGGPLPLLCDPEHRQLTDFLRALGPSLNRPAAIVVISAHWEAAPVTITSGESPGLIYDYYGFPEAAYRIQYPAPGAPWLAEKILGYLNQAGIPARLDPERGFDHGLFVPLKLMFPAADIPCVQISLLRGLEPAAHIDIGKALAGLRADNALVLGSGFSFHNMDAFFAPRDGRADAGNLAFEAWLHGCCVAPNLRADEREQRLINWRTAPFAAYCHPCAEHLLPLHVCQGLAGLAAKRIFFGEALGKQTSAFMW